MKISHHNKKIALEQKKKKKVTFYSPLTFFLNNVLG